MTGTPLADVRNEALARGYVEGLDFYISGFHTSFSSELVLLVTEGEELQVLYRDMGRERLLTSGATVDMVRGEFFAALRRLGRAREAVPAAKAAPAGPRSDSEKMADFLNAFPDAIVPEGDR